MRRRLRRAAALIANAKLVPFSRQWLEKSFPQSPASVYGRPLPRCCLGARIPRRLHGANIGLRIRWFTVHAQASPPDTKRSHRSARLGWVTFWVTQKIPPRQGFDCGGIYGLGSMPLPGTRFSLFITLLPL